jgi:Subtilase family
VNAAALLLPFVVALPPGATAPPPGSLPHAARVSALDRDLGLALVRLPKRGLAPALRRLRAGPGVRYVERDAPIELSGEGCGAVSSQDAKADPAWHSAIHLSTRSAAGMVIGMADSGIDDDRLAPRQPPLLHLSSGGKAVPHDPIGHGTAVASILIANRPDVRVMGLAPDATLLSARIIRSSACNQAALEHGLVEAFGWLRQHGAQVVNVSATAHRSHALLDSLRALQLSGALVVAAVGNDGIAAKPTIFPASEPGVLGVGGLKAGSSTQVWRKSTRGPQVDLVAPMHGIRVIASSAEGVSQASETANTPDGTSFAAPLVTAAAAMVWATHRDWTAAEVASALTSTATPLGKQVPSRSSGYGVLNVSRALHAQKLPDSHEPNDWVAAAVAQRHLRPGSVVVASLGYAGDDVDAYTVDVPRGATVRATLRGGARGLTLDALPAGTTDAKLWAAARGRPRASQITLPSGRSLVVVGRNQGAGPYTLALSGASGSPGA